MSGTIYPFVISILSDRVNKDDLILEIGCGGMQYRPFISGRYEGLDLPTSPYLNEAPFYNCSAEQIPCEDGRFNIVFGVGTFLIIPDIARTLSECHRVLKKGGRLVIFDYQKHVCQQLRHSDPNHRHIWDFKDLTLYLSNAGFELGCIYDITEEANYRGLFRRALSYIFPHLRHIPTWLIVEAIKK